MPFLVGMDLVDVSDVEDSLARFGERYLNRVFTPREIAACDGGTNVQRLAACFAAKEATLKALRTHDEPLDWRTIEVIVPAAGDPCTVLHGSSADLATAQSVTNLAVSITAGDAYAAAVVLVELPGDASGMRENA